VIDLATGSRRDDVTASVGELRASKSGRFVVALDYERQRAMAVHCLDGLLRQLADDDMTAGITQRCRRYVNVQQQNASSSSNTFDDVCAAHLSTAASQPQQEITIDEFNQRCKLPPPPPVCTTILCTIRDKQYVRRAPKAQKISSFSLLPALFVTGE